MPTGETALFYARELSIQSMGEPIRVLHVDDDPELAETTASFLERDDDRFAVETATGASEGLDKLAEGEFDCVISDYEMPATDGLAFLETVRETYPELPFILFTGKGSEDVASEAISSGVTDYLQKESTVEQYTVLANKVSNAVDRYHARRAVERSEHQVRRTYERITDGFFTVDTDWQYTYVNEEGAHLVDQSKDELLGTTVWEVFPDIVDTPFEDALRTAMETRQTTTAEAYYPAHDTWYEVRVYPDEEGISTFFQDVTERKERERTLTALHEATREIGRAERATVYETLIDTAEEVLDFDLVVVDIERDGYLVQEAWTLDIEDGGYWEQVSLEEDDTLTVRAYNRQETIQVNHPSETDVMPADPEYRSALTVPIGEFGTFQAVFSQANGFDEYDREFAELLVDHARVKLSQLGDKRELRERTTELERQNERLDEFASFVSHDLRNPLNVATLRLDLLARESDSEHLPHIEGALDRMEHLIDDLLALARDGETVEDAAPVRLEEVVSRCWESIEVGDAALDCRTDRTLYADESKLQGVLENLFQNAIEHGDEDVTITVGDLPEGFYVADDGDGIAAEDRERLFESGHSTKPGGTGLGLTIVRDIVEAHGWEIRAVKSETGGARFEITGVDDHSGQ